MRMRMTLLLSVMSVSIGLTALTLVVIHKSLQRQIQQSLSSDLERSIVAFQNLQLHRREILHREAALLADEPRLKALMTVMLRSSPDNARTVRDQGLEFWRVSGAAFFALADPKGEVVARYEEGAAADIADTPSQLPENLVTGNGTGYVLHDGRLYETVSAPIYFGSPTEGTLLGYVTIGYAIDPRPGERDRTGGRGRGRLHRRRSHCGDHARCDADQRFHREANRPVKGCGRGKRSSPGQRAVPARLSRIVSGRRFLTGSNWRAQVL